MKCHNKRKRQCLCIGYFRTVPRGENGADYRDWHECKIEIGRVTKAVQKGSFLHRYYSKREQGIIGKRLTSAATNFAGKEAVVKALGTGFACFASRSRNS